MIRYTRYIIMRTIVISCYIVITVSLLLTGCEKKSKNNNDDDAIKMIVQKTVEALDSKDADKIKDLFYDKAIQDKGYNALSLTEINRFLVDYSGSRRVIYNDGSHIIGNYKLDGKRFDTYAAVVALVETEDDIYHLNFFFCVPKNSNNMEDIFLIALQITTAKSEAYNNEFMENEYITGNRESFSYINYNDSAFDNAATEYRVIMSQILSYDENATVITEEEANQFIKNDVTTKEEILNQFGKPAAIYTDVGDIEYYATDIKEKYLQITYHMGKDIVRRYDIVGELYPNWEELYIY